MSSYVFVSGDLSDTFTVGLCDARALCAVAEEVRVGKIGWTAARPCGALTYRVQRWPFVGGDLTDPDTGLTGDAHSQAAWARAELFGARAASPVDEVRESWAEARLAQLGSVTRTPWLEAPLAQGSLVSRVKALPAVLGHLVSGYTFTSGAVGWGGGDAHVLWRHGVPVAACVVKRREPRQDRLRFTILVRQSCRQTDVRILADYLLLKGFSECATYAQEHAHEAPVFA